MAVEKTVWVEDVIIFVGVLLDGRWLLICLPLEKQEKALRLLKDIADRKKATIKQIQTLTGYLNFLTKAIPVGQTFTRRMYSRCAQMEVTKSGKRLKQHHHVTLDNKFKFDCNVWRVFLEHYRNAAVCRPMIDFGCNFSTTRQLNFATDASKNESGFGEFSIITGCVVSGNQDS